MEIQPLQHQGAAGHVCAEGRVTPDLRAGVRGAAGWLALVALAMATAAGWIAWAFLTLARREARSLPADAPHGG